MWSSLEMSGMGLVCVCYYKGRKGWSKRTQRDLGMDTNVLKRQRTRYAEPNAV